MRKDLEMKPSVFPEPTFIIAAYDDKNVPCCMTCAWGGIVAKTQIMLSINPGHKTVDALKHSQAFTVSMGQADQVKACDYVGIVSAHDVPDKFARAGFHATKSVHVNAPLIDELAYTLECKVASYDDETHVLIGDIVNISADERVINPDGTVNVAELKPISFDGRTVKYYLVGEAVADARSVGKELK